jgi:hypothetical protein
VLRHEVVWLHARWDCYSELLGHSDRRIALLNESASSFFFVIEEVLFDEVQVALSWLMSSHGMTGGKVSGLMPSRSVTPHAKGVRHRLHPSLGTVHVFSARKAVKLINSFIQSRTGGKNGKVSN